MIQAARLVPAQLTLALHPPALRCRSSPVESSPTGAGACAPKDRSTGRSLARAFGADGGGQAWLFAIVATSSMIQAARLAPAQLILARLPPCAPLSLRPVSPAPLAQALVLRKTIRRGLGGWVSEDR